jgi:hypothetical protein
MFMFINHDFMSWKFWKLSHKKFHDIFLVSFVLFDIPISWTIVYVFVLYDRLAKQFMFYLMWCDLNWFKKIC